MAVLALSTHDLDSMIVMGLAGGFVISQARLSPRRWLNWPSLVYVGLF